MTLKHRWIYIQVMFLNRFSNCLLSARGPVSLSHSLRGPRTIKTISVHKNLFFILNILSFSEFTVHRWTSSSLLINWLYALSDLRSRPDALVIDFIQRQHCNHCGFRNYSLPWTSPPFVVLHPGTEVDSPDTSYHQSTPNSSSYWSGECCEMLPVSSGAIRSHVVSWKKLENLHKQTANKKGGNLPRSTQIRRVRKDREPTRRTRERLNMMLPPLCFTVLHESRRALCQDQMFNLFFRLFAVSSKWNFIRLATLP